MTRAETDPAFEALLEYLRDDRGFDFTGYKRSTLVRRVCKRMEEVGIGDYAAYRGYLAEHPDEFTWLFNTILINVTSFWRDPEAWDALTREHVPRMVAEKAGEPIRIWTAGCASGEETYTVAMAMAEALGEDRFREQVKIYATDVDDDALLQARMAAYPPKALEAVPEALRERYFERAPGGRYVFRGDLRRQVIFGRHDLVRDAPISHLDLLVSRNTLMYFNAAVQARVVNRFHFALNEKGVLFLGKAEMMRAHGDLFTPLDLRARVFQKVGRASLRDRLLMMGQPPRRESQERLSRQVRLRDAALDAAVAAQLVVDTAGTVVLANAAARSLFGLSAGDVGRPLQDLTVSYRPVELRSCIEQAYAGRREVHLPGVEFPCADGEFHTFDVQVVPLPTPDGGFHGVAVAFVDVTPLHRLHAELQEASQEMETAFEELQSANEELETTNEELQSTNEELETMNEELQSTNEELETLNDELQRRTAELNDVSAHMGSILTSLRSAMVVLDHSLDVVIWNRKAEDLWGLRADEVVGKAFQNLDIGLPVEQLKAPVRACIEGRSDVAEMVLEAVNRRGRAIRCRVTCTPFVGTDLEIRGAVLLMDEWREPGPGEAREGRMAGELNGSPES